MLDVSKLKAEVTPIVDKYIGEHPELVAAYRAGGTSVLAGALPKPKADTPGLAWVTDGQQATLQGWQPIRGDWHEWLPEQLTEWWPQWQQATPDVLTTTLDEWMPSLITYLTWVTPEQQAALGTDWFDLVRAKLDEVWPGWYEETNPAEHAKWLAGWWHVLAGPPAAPPAASAEPDAEKATQVTLAKLIGELPRLAKEQGVAVEELAAELKEMEKEGLFSEIASKEGGAA